ncbi:hypothetical protein BOFE_08570 (plasmid) [Candidatus Borrelia fainii]|uniref:Uncharacterized protein n=1 Tax=Candidatus Borrelia fainii TaxID=2518322 RepID=A0ABN6USE5_9SPIR|nr:hypothetical protein [Candidatus Borrelia fainii]BDU62465.1 hypothetical protein BOFE_00050 [Candidatus Borrelia fainii]BDU63308.1 hypothetical protein BOFE_08480 [Candidatus Borrelia fainii]BDU63317.1 hypothetical protein BOFE_08570 [Candidatus Borrelia fainii]
MYEVIDEIFSKKMLDIPYLNIPLTTRDEILTIVTIVMKYKLLSLLRNS